MMGVFILGVPTGVGRCCQGAGFVAVLALMDSKLFMPLPCTTPYCCTHFLSPL